MYNEQIEGLMSAALADGVLTEREKQILFKKAQSQGIDLDEFEMVLDARLVELQKAEKEKAEKSAPKSTKYGDVRKCPVCGALVPALATSCPECGYEFSGIQGNLSTEKLGQALMNAHNDNQKASIVSSFPIPTTKADLFEFVVTMKSMAQSISLSTKAEADLLSGTTFRVIGLDLKRAYFAKYKECIIKINMLFKNDKIFEDILLDDKAFSKKINKEIWLKQHKKSLIIFCVIIGYIILFVCLYNWLLASEL